MPCDQVEKGAWVHDREIKPATLHSEVLRIARDEHVGAPRDGRLEKRVPAEVARLVGPEIGLLAVRGIRPSCNNSSGRGSFSRTICSFRTSCSASLSHAVLSARPQCSVARGSGGKIQEPAARHSMKLVKPERIWLKDHAELNEKWVQERIAEDPSIVLVDRVESLQ